MDKNISRGWLRYAICQGLNHGVTKRVIWTALRGITPVFVFTGLTILGAQIRIPIPGTPVPVTLQTFFVLLSGAWLGGGRGCLSQIFYVLLGVLGMPVFSGNYSGMAVLLGPTGGYLIGFMLAPLLVNFLCKKNQKTFLGNFISLWLGGSLIIFGCGIINLVYVHSLSLEKALSLGFYPFIIGDILKIGLASSLLKARSISKKRF